MKLKFVIHAARLQEPGCMEIVIAITSHLSMRGFVKDFTVWIHHAKMVITIRTEEEHMDDHNYIDACITKLNGEMGGHKQGGSGRHRDSLLQK